MHLTAVIPIVALVLALVGVFYARSSHHRNKAEDRRLVAERAARNRPRLRIDPARRRTIQQMGSPNHVQVTIGVSNEGEQGRFQRLSQL